MELKKVSVIIPVYNAETYIEACIRSVLCQNYANIELILINDGSSDRSGEICAEYAHKYGNIIYRHQENAGVSCARNSGLDVATGDYVIFVDSDDKLKSNMVASLVDAMKNEDVDLSICGYDTVRSEGVTPTKIDGQTVFGQDKLAEYFAEHFAEATTSAVFCKMYKRSFIQHRFHSELSMGEDLLFNLEYIRNISSVAAISQTLYSYNKTNNNALTRNYKAAYHKQNLYVFKRWLEWFDGFDCINDIHIHLRIVNSYLTYLFHVLSGTLAGDKLQLVQAVIDDNLAISLGKAKSRLRMRNRLVLYLATHRRYRALIAFGSAYCKSKK